jgi:hypothetical protein
MLSGAKHLGHSPFAGKANQRFFALLRMTKSFPL